MRCLSVGLVVYFLFLCGGCAEPPVTYDLPPLTGEYEGVYRVTRNWGDSIHQFTDWNYILWTFDEWRFRFGLDSTRHTGHCFCAVTGQYTLQKGIYFRVTTAVVDNVNGCRHCDEREVPSGGFVRETKGDSLIVYQLVDSVYKELRLLRVK